MSYKNGWPRLDVDTSSDSGKETISLREAAGPRPYRREKETTERPLAPRFPLPALPACLPAQLSTLPHISKEINPRHLPSSHTHACLTVCLFALHYLNWRLLPLSKVHTYARQTNQEAATALAKQIDGSPTSAARGHGSCLGWELSLLSGRNPKLQICEVTSPFTSHPFYSQHRMAGIFLALVLDSFPANSPRVNQHSSSPHLDRSSFLSTNQAPCLRTWHISPSNCSYACRATHKHTNRNPTLSCKFPTPIPSPTLTITSWITRTHQSMRTLSPVSLNFMIRPIAWCNVVPPRHRSTSCLSVTAVVATHL